MDSNSSSTTRGTTLTIHGFSKQVYHYHNAKDSNHEISDDRNLVDDVAAVKFEIRPKRNEKDGEDDVLLYMLYKKQECKEDALINVKLTCENPKYCKEFPCFTKDIRTLIFQSRATWRFGNVRTFEIHIYVQAYQVPTHNKSEMFYNDEDFTDFCFVTNDGKVPVHRACMVAHSEVFKAMLHGEWKETVDGHIKIQGEQVTLQTLKNLKDYMYLAKLPNDEVELQTLLLIADRFMMHYLKDECIRKLTSLVTADNFLNILEFATCNKFTKLTFSILLLTPEDVVCEAYNLVKNELDGPGQG